MPKGRKKRATARKPKSKAAPAADGLDIESVTGYNLRRAHSVQRQRFAAMFAPYGIRPVQLSILGLLRDHPRMKQSDLGRTLEIKRANIVVLLDELEQRGLIVRKPAETDRRAYELELTGPSARRQPARTACAARGRGGGAARNARSRSTHRAAQEISAARDRPELERRRLIALSAYAPRAHATRSKSSSTCKNRFVIGPSGRVT